MNNTPVPAPSERQLPEFNAMQKVKRRFFAMRNGDLAQQMKERGADYQINFGLNLPQISEIACDFLPGGEEYADLPADFDMADFSRRLRENRTTRESMLIAPMLFPVEKLGWDEALEWCREARTPEVVDVLCLKLLRKWNRAGEMVNSLVGSEVDLDRYCALRLLLNLLQIGTYNLTDASELCGKEELRGCRLTASLCRQLRDEIELAQY